VTVTYERARETVLEHFASGWTHGTFCLDDRQIAENEEFYVFNIGAREFIVDGDNSYAIIGGVTVVLKEGGRIESRPSVAIATDRTIKTRPNPNPTFAND
jgi:5-formaminoimidazole-4-carboxamide-1-beta-D-ribofuranosyl 5'-monophosphate synthetase